MTLRQQWNDKRLRFEELLKAKGVGEGKNQDVITKQIIRKTQTLFRGILQRPNKLLFSYS